EGDGHYRHLPLHGQQAAHRRLQPAEAWEPEEGDHGRTGRFAGHGVTPWTALWYGPASRSRIGMDVSDIKSLQAEVKKRMDQAVEHVRRELSGVRTGRASVSLLDSVHVEAYGALMPLNQVATLSVPESTLIVAQPFDPSQMAAIEKAIRAANLGLNPANDGKVVRIPLPALREEPA